MADTSIDQIRPVKQRRTGYDTSHWFDTPQYTKRDLATIALNARNEELSNMTSMQKKMAFVKSLAVIPWSNSTPGTAAYRTDMVAEHMDVAGHRPSINFLRNNHPLVAYKHVQFDFAYDHWIVDLNSSTLSQLTELPLFIGQCPVYLHGITGILPPHNPFSNYMVFASVDPRKLVDDISCQRIKNDFPSSIGMRVHIYGFIEIFYSSEKKIRHDLRNATHDFPTTICEINYTLKVVDVQFTSGFAHGGFGYPGPREEEVVELNTPIAQGADRLEAEGCVGVRIRRQGDQADSWTTVTHPWMKNPPPPSDLTNLEFRWRTARTNAVAFVRRAENFLREKMRGHREPCGTNQHDAAAKARVEGQDYPTVLGTKVYVAGSNIKVGSISHCYDSLALPEPTASIPAGLDHDLSLITAEAGETLPPMINGPNLAKPKDKFATPAEILNADSPQAFHAFYKFDAGERLHGAGHTVTGNARKAIISGTDYWWEQRHLKVKRSIIWRTFPDDFSMAAGGSGGGVICLGNPAAATCTAAVFQNYESRTMARNKSWKHDILPSRRLKGCGDVGSSYKGGFILPDDIQNATIVFQEGGATP